MNRSETFILIAAFLIMLTALTAVQMENPVLGVVAIVLLVVLLIVARRFRYR